MPETADPAHISACFGGEKCIERLLMMNQAGGWMGGWGGGGMWVWTVIGILVVALLVVVIGKLSKK